MTNNINLEKEEILSLIEKDRVHKRVYTDPEIFELEMEKIWGTAWIFIGHESQVKKPGDYFATTLGREPVLMTRHSDGQVKVMFNRCAHKGAQLVGDSCGNARQLRCCYHGYVFDTDGTLLHIPMEEGYAKTEFCKGNAEMNIRQVPRMEIYRGFVFASLASEGPDLITWLGSAASSIDNTVERSPEGEVEITGGTLRYLHDANWKVLLENVTDNMHPLVNHQSAYQPAKQIGQQFSDEDKPFAISMLEPFGSAPAFFDEVAMTICGNGHSYAGGDVSIHSAYGEESQYVKDMIASYGKERAYEILSVNRQNTIVYPSIAFKSALQTIRIYRPIAVNKTIQETWTFRLKGVPEDMLHRSVIYNQTIFSPASIAGNDDYEAYHRIQHGLASQGSDWVSQHRYLGKSTDNGDGTTTAPGTSDIVFRHEFEAWRDYMGQ